MLDGHGRRLHGLQGSATPPGAYRLVTSDHQRWAATPAVTMMVTRASSGQMTQPHMTDRRVPDSAEC
jgi:hypothetical protein